MATDDRCAGGKCAPMVAVVDRISSAPADELEYLIKMIEQRRKELSKIPKSSPLAIAMDTVLRQQDHMM